MNEECLVFVLTGSGYSIGNSSGDSSLNYHNGIKDECVNSLEHIIVPRSHEGKIVYRLDYQCFRNLPQLKTAFIPNTITSLCGDTFTCCNNLDSVVFEEGSKLRDLHHYTFFSTNLAFIDIPSSVERIRGFTFSHMNNLKAIYFHSFIKQGSSDTFVSTNISNIKIYVPRDYPNETLFGIPIIPVLEPLKKRTQIPNHLCRRSNNIPLIACMILLCY